MSRWLWSQKALSLFHYAAWVVVCVGMFMTFMATPWFWQLAAMPRGQLLLRILGGTAGVLGGPASLVLIFGMTVSCIREDNSSTSTKVFWAVFCFFTAPFGAMVYFFSVYRKRVQAEGYVHVDAT
jgi:Phospholipase_D-nuclease N-terminal